MLVACDLTKGGGTEKTQTQKQAKTPKKPERVCGVSGPFPGDWSPPADGPRPAHRCCPLSVARVRGRLGLAFLWLLVTSWGISRWLSPERGISWAAAAEAKARASRWGERSIHVHPRMGSGQGESETAAGAWVRGCQESEPGHFPVGLVGQVGMRVARGSISAPRQLPVTCPAAPSTLVPGISALSFTLVPHGGSVRPLTTL